MKLTWKSFALLLALNVISGVIVAWIVERKNAPSWAQIDAQQWGTTP